MIERSVVANSRDPSHGTQEVHIRYFVICHSNGFREILPSIPEPISLNKGPQASATGPPAHERAIAVGNPSLGQDFVIPHRLTDSYWTK